MPELLCRHLAVTRFLAEQPQVGMIVDAPARQRHDVIDDEQWQVPGRFSAFPSADTTASVAGDAKVLKAFYALLLPSPTAKTLSHGQFSKIVCQIEYFTVGLLTLPYQDTPIGIGEVADSTA